MPYDKEDIYELHKEAMQDEDTRNLKRIISRAIEAEREASPIPNSPLTKQERTIEPFLPGNVQREGESNLEYQYRVYDEAGYTIPPEDLRKLTSEAAREMVGSNILMYPTMVALNYVYGTVPAMKKKTGEIYSAIKSELAAYKEPLQPKDPSEVKEGTEGLLANPYVLALPAIGAEHDIRGAKIEPIDLAIKKTLTDIGYALSPFDTPAQMVQAAFAHNYESDSITGNVMEFIGATGEAAFKAMFPVYGETSDYAERITDKLFPGASPNIKIASALAISVLSDPTVTFTMGISLMTKFGTQINRALLLARKIPTRGFFRRGLETMLKIRRLPAENAEILRVLVARAETGDKTAIDALNKVLDQPVESNWINLISNQAYEDSLEHIANVKGLSRKAMVKAHLPFAERDFRKGIIESKVTKELKVLQEQGVTGKPYKKAGSKIYKETDEFVSKMDLTEAQRGQVLQRAEAMAEEEMAIRSKELRGDIDEFLKAQDQVDDLLTKPKYRQEVKKDWSKKDLENLTPYVRGVLEDYRKAGGGKTTIRELTGKASKVELETLLDEPIKKNWTPEQYLAANIAANKLKNEAVRLATLATHTGSYDSIYEAEKAISLFSELEGRILGFEEAWGQSGLLMQELQKHGGDLSKIAEKELEFAIMQSTGKDAAILSKANFFLQAEQHGGGATFLKFLKHPLKLAANINDTLFEGYVGNLISAISTHTLSLGANVYGTTIYPLERFLTTFAGNWTGAIEALHGYGAVFTGFRDSFFMYRDMVMQSRFPGRVLPQHWKDASVIRMLELNKTYPKELLNPWGFMKDGKGAAAHEIEEILRHKKISSANWGLKPGGVLGGPLDFMGVAARAPGNAMKFVDSIFKMAGYNMGAKMEAYRVLHAAGKKMGPAVKNNQQLANIVNNIVYKANAKKITQEGSHVANYITLQSKLGSIAKTIDKTLGMRFPAWFFPFRKTMINSIKQVGERTPLGYGNVFIKAMEGDAIGAQTSMVRATLGTLVGLYFAYSMPEDAVTGNFDETSEYGRKMYGLGFKPTQIRTSNGTWISYNDITYLKGVLGFVADHRRAISMLNARDPTEVTMIDQLSANFAMPFIKMAMNTRWINETSKLMYYMSAIGEGSESIGSSIMKEFSRKAADTLVPYSALLKEYNRNMLDNHSHISESFLREIVTAQGFLDEMKMRIPGMAKGLPSYTNIFGEPTLYPSDIPAGLYHTAKAFVNPLNPNHPDMSLVAKELVRIPFGVPPIATHIKGVVLSARERAIVQQATGQGVRGAPPLYQAFLEEMGRPEYAMANDRGKASLLEKIHGMYRSNAVLFILEESQRNGLVSNELWQKVDRKMQWDMQQYGTMAPQDMRRANVPYP